jgi:U3 small nucleolar RNA-associated protein 7
MAKIDEASTDGRVPTATIKARSMNVQKPVQKPKRKHSGGQSKDAEEPGSRLSGHSTKLAKGKHKKMTESEKLLRKKSEKYQRGERNTSKGITDKKLKASIQHQEKLYSSAALEATRAELLLTEEAGYLEASGMEKTYKYTQAEISKHVDVNTSSKMFSLKLDTFGPYMLDYTRSGRHLALAGAKGHIALVDAYEQDLVTEFNVRETIRDIQWLHNESMFAVAQKKYVYIYDNSGMEIHCLRDHSHINRMDYLPYHFLLAMVGRAGMLHYRDTSTGQIVATHRTKLGPCDCLKQNSNNGIINLGHANGTVTLWSPNVSTPLVKLLAHRGPVRALDVDKGGNYLVTAGEDQRLSLHHCTQCDMITSSAVYTPDLFQIVQCMLESCCLALTHLSSLSSLSSLCALGSEQLSMTAGTCVTFGLVS